MITKTARGVFMSERCGQNTIMFSNRPKIRGFASVAGKTEENGPFGKEFDVIFEDEYSGENTFEEAESRLVTTAVETLLKKTQMSPEQVDILFAGDLLNQCAGSTFGVESFGIPYVGVYGACSTMALSLGLAAAFVDAGFAKNAAAVTSSHFCSSERQFRLPLEYGGQRTGSAQWTVTGAGAIIVCREIEGVDVKSATFGKITDFDVTDVNNMGAAMAPAAARTVCEFFDDTGMSPEDFDLILTGDLGKVGSELLLTLMKEENRDITAVHSDCGLNVFYLDTQDVHAGGSGCGCSASVLCSRILRELSEGKYKNLLICATGALHSPVTVFQKKPIPSIAHAIWLSSK